MNRTIGIDRTGHKLNATIDPATFTPLKGRILVEREPAVDRIGSILLPEGAGDRAHKGTVISIGKDVTWVKTGDVVHFSARGRPEVHIGSALFNVIAEQDLYGVEE